MSKNEIKPVGRKKEIVIQEFNNEILIYDLTSHKAFSLNETSALVWQACDGSKTVSEISNQMSRQLKSAVTEDFVWLALEQLKKENLIENESEVSLPFEGLTRREVIRRVGFASIIALPIISSLIAPSAAQAQSACGAASGRPLGCSCTANSQCVGTASTQCCSRVPGTSRTCVVARTLRNTNETCGNNCDCISNNCIGPVGNGICG